jgi:erythromycin esterase-like protein
MWANEEVADFLEWLRSHNETVPTADKVGFYGLDVYSLWDSLRRIIQWLEENDPSAVAAALEAWHCFSPYDEDPHRYAWATRLVPEACEDQVVALLVEVRRQAAQLNPLDDAAFDAFQNAEVVAGAEHYYRAMVRGDRESWNVRDRHMTDTIERIWRHRGLRSHGLIWEHNTHLGDARATDMARSGMVNVGQLLRERHEGAGVSLVGFAGHHGTVIAASQWGEAERVMAVPDARPGSHEDLLHRALGIPALVLFGHDRSGPWLSTRAGHRAIGVVYDSRMEAGNYVPTRMGDRYDALIWLENTSALHPLHHEGPPMDEEFETEPTGY